jgi:hypothetical protein
LESYLAQITSNDTEAYIANIEGAAMRMPSPNRDDELDDAQEDISPIGNRNEISRMNKTGDMGTNEEWFYSAKEAANTEGRATPKERFKPSKTLV